MYSILLLRLINYIIIECLLSMKKKAIIELVVSFILITFGAVFLIDNDYIRIILIGMNIYYSSHIFFLKQKLSALEKGDEK